MKKILLISSLAIFAFACNNNDTKMSDSKMTTADMPFPLDHPYDNWQAGDPQHAVTVMNGLKAFANGDVNTSMNAFGDSVRIGFDYYQAKMSKDSLKAMLMHER